MSDGKNRRYGIIAGWGNYPILLAQAIRDAGHEVVCLGALGHADPSLAEICDVFEYIGLAKFGYACRYFRKHGVSEVMMAGKIFKNLLFQKGFFFRQIPDFYTIRIFAPIFFSRKHRFNNDTLLLAATEALERRGLKLVAGTDIVPSMLVGRGTLTKRIPTRAEWDDIRCAWPLARELGRLDIGQLVTVKQQKILSVEGIEGTDETARRANVLAQGEPFVMVKIAKPNQDMRFDVPTFGLETLRTMVASHANVLAIEADRSIFIEPREELIAFADAHGIAMVSLTENDLSQEEFLLSSFEGASP